MEKIGAFADADRVTTEGEWQPGNPATGQKATPMLSAWFNMLQRELVGVVEAAGLTLDANNEAQLLEALTRMAGRNVTNVDDADSPKALTIAEAGLVMVDATNGNVTLNLPAAADNGGLGYQIVRLDSTANTVTVARDGTDTIDGATSLDIAAADRRELVCDGASSWRRPEPVASETLRGMVALANSTQAGDHQNGTHALTAASLIAGVLGGGSAATNGHAEFPYRDAITGELKRLILQWGTATANTGAGTLANFPIAFPNSCVVAGIGRTESVGSPAEYVQVLGHSTTTLTGVTYTDVANKISGELSFSWFAIGH